MRQLSVYAFANAKIRAMLSFLIPAETFNRLLEVKGVYEILEELKKTPYGPVLEQSGGLDPLDLQAIERALVRHELAVCRKIQAMLSSKPEKDFLALLVQRYEVEQLKVCLRLWHRRQPVVLNDYIAETGISHDIDYRKIVSAGSIEEIILLLDHTAYKQPLMQARQKYRERHASFYLEAGLDADYYARLLAATGRFSRIDRGIAGRILGVEIDIRNINWLVRLRKYYGLGMGEMMEGVVSGGTWITRERVRGMYVSDGLGSVVQSVALGPYARIKDMVEDHVAVMENFLYGFLLQEVKKALSGFPFTIGTVLGYLVLKHRETRNIVSVLYARHFGWEKEQIAPVISV